MPLRVAITLPQLGHAASGPAIRRAAVLAEALGFSDVWVNDHIPIISEMPHGGYKASGYGKDMSQYSLDEYTQVKHVMQDITAVARKDWHRTVFGDR